MHLVPVYGLCNRMRAMASAVEITSRNDLDLKIYWKKDKDLDAPFFELFTDLSCAHLVEVNKDPWVFRHGCKSNFYFPDLVRMRLKDKFWNEHATEKIKLEGFSYDEYFKRNDELYLKSYNYLEKNHSNFSIFKPIPKLQERINIEISNFCSNTIGVHIRRKDNMQSIIQSPLKVFYREMDKAIEQNSKTNFYVVSDDATIKKKVYSRYGSRIQTNFEDAKRTNVLGMQRAVIELFALSETSKILGSFWSSFSQVGASIKGIPLLVVKK